MTSFGEVFGGTSIKADDLKSTGPQTYTIKFYRMAQLTAGEPEKLELGFEETPNTLICNLTNGRVLLGLYGSDLDKWIGKRITLYETMVQFKSSMVPGIRVRQPDQPQYQQQQAPHQPPQQAPPQQYQQPQATQYAQQPPQMPQQQQPQHTGVYQAQDPQSQPQLQGAPRPTAATIAQQDDQVPF